MTLCPIALMATSNKCPAVGSCPLKEVLGDHKPEAGDGEAAKAAPSDKPASSLHFHIIRECEGEASTVQAYD